MKCLAEFVLPEGEFPEAVLRALLEAMLPYPVVLMEAPMGSGKTTLVGQLARLLGVQEAVQSPTFPLIVTYALPQGVPGGLDHAYHTLVHMDLYRLEDTEQALDIGVEEYFSRGHWCWVEWPVIVEPLLGAEALRMQIQVLEQGSRKILLFSQ
jgi:tRNA threonylcarbamoyladenosine biosynthesis protein TsaE